MEWTRRELAGAVADLVNDAYRLAQTELFDEVVPRTTSAEVAAAIRDGDLYVAELGGRLVGSVMVRVLDESTTHVGTLAVAPRAAGRGVARAILDHVEGSSREAGRPVVCLDLLVPDPATDHQERLRRWYERRGYRPTSRRSFARVEPRAADRLRHPTALVRYEKRVTADGRTGPARGVVESEATT